MLTLILIFRNAFLWWRNTPAYGADGVPRGAVGMERMSALYPDSFVYAVYHIYHKGEDPMATVDALPSDDALAPPAYIDRTLFVHPYNGLSAETAVTADDGIGEARGRRNQLALPALYH